MRKLTLLLLLLSTLAVLLVNGQTGTSCLNPKTMTLTAGQSTGWRSTDHDSLWITFVADTTIQNYVISAKLNYKKQIVGVYQKYSCNINDNLINAVHPNDSTFYVSYTNLVVGQSYKLLLISVADTACKTCNDTLVNGNSKSVGMIERTSSQNMLGPFYLIWSNPDGTSGNCSAGFWGGVGSVCSTTICLGESVCFAYNFLNMPQLPESNYAYAHMPLYFNDGNQIMIEYPMYSGPNPTGCVSYTPTSAGITSAYVVNQVTFNIVVVAPQTPQYTFNPASPICLGTCVQFSSLNSNVINYDFSSSDSYIGCPSGGPGNTYPNAFNFNNAGINTVNYTINAGHTCSATVTQTIEVIDPKLTIQQLGDLCSLTHTFIATVNCNQSTNFTWNVYNGTSNSGTLIYSQSSATNLVYTFPSAGTYYVEASTTPNAFGMNTVSGNIITIGAPANNLSFSYNSIDCTKLSSCFTTNANCVLPNTTWLWTMDGNPVSTQQNPCLTFPSIGSHTVCVTQNNNTFGNTNPNLIVTNCQIINVTGAPVVVVTNTLTSICSAPNGLATFTATNTAGGATPFWLWNATDVLTGAAIAINPTVVNNMATYNFTSLANYTNPITICVTAINGCAATTCFTILPCCPAPSGTTIYPNYTFNSNTTLSGNIKFSGLITINNNVNVDIISANVSFDPNTKVIIKNNAKLYVLKSYLHACNAMWDGMYLYNNSNIQLEASTIEDAKRAVIDTLGASNIKIVNVLFNKNYESIVLKRANTTTNLKLENNVFACDLLPAGYQQAIPLQAITITPVVANSLPNTILLAPYNTICSYSGISLFQTRTTVNANQYVELNKYNLFDKLRYGIVATRSRVLVQKCRFQNITTSGHNEYAGIYAYGVSAAFYLGATPDISIGGNTAQANTFENCTFGVLNKYKYNMAMSSNTLTNMNVAGVMVTKNKWYVSVDKNKFFDCLVGVNLYDNSILKSDITNNRMVNNPGIGNYSTNFGVFVGDVVTSLLPNRNCNIYNNFINRYYNGIYATNTFSTQITDNEVHLRPDNAAGHFQTGIRLENTNTAHIYNNIIDKPLAALTATWQVGIYANTNPTPRMWCNSIDNMAASIKFDGLNLTNNTGLGIIGNVMNHAHYGIWLDHQAEIGDQFANLLGLKASDNQWFGFSPVNPQTFTDNGSNISGSKMFTKGASGGTYYLNPTNANTTGFLGAQMLLGNFAYPSISINCNNNTPTPAIMIHGNNLATNSMGFAGNVANMYAIGKRQLLQNIRAHNINLATNATLKAFVDSAYSTHIGQFYQVDSMITKAVITNDSALLVTASALNNSIINTGNIVYNKQSINNTYISLLNAEPDSAIMANLRNLAIKCPNLEGDAVFQARSMLMYYEGISYTSICDDYVNHSRIASNEEGQPNGVEINELRIYPNPSNGQLTIDYSKEEGKADAEIIIYNQLGSVVWQQVLTEASTTLNLQTLSNGIYLYYIKQDNNTLKTNKLIITN